MMPSEHSNTGELARLAAALFRDAADYQERSRQAAATGSSVGAREWLDAAHAATKAAREIAAELESRS